MKTAQIRGVEARQHGRRILVGVISASDLAALYESGRLVVDVFSASNPDGYQRTLSRTRSRKFGRFIANPKTGISPTALLIYCRDTHGGMSQSGPSEYSIPLAGGGKPVLYICDGQHRTDGIAEALKEGWLTADDDYDIPVTVLFWDPKRSPGDQRLEEALQFYVLNTQQKRMRTDLAHQYIFRRRVAEGGPIDMGTVLTRMKKREYIPYAIFIAGKMRSSTESPWQNRILLPNAKGDLPITEGSFTDSLTPVLDYAVQASLTTGNVVSLLSSFWSAVFGLCKQAYSNPKDYVLMKTAGVFSLHIFLPLLLIRKPDLGVNSTAADFRRVLSSVGGCFADEFWDAKTGDASAFGTGRKSFQELADHIAGELE